MTETQTLVPLTEAAHELALTREVLLRRLLTQELRGKKIAGRWFVEAADLERAKREGSTSPAGNAA